MKKTVLIVEDSPVMQKVIARAVGLSPILQVIGVAADAFEARKMILEKKPDLITLDLQLPKVDGLSFLESVMSHLPQKIVVISGFTQKGSKVAMKALELGAIDVIEKPSAEIIRNDMALKSLITDRIASAAGGQLQFKNSAIIPSKDVSHAFESKNLIAVASSTGGTEALKVFLSGFGRSCPPILIAQHMPQHFTKVFAENLQKILPLKVHEAIQGQKVEVNSVYLAPGDFHMEVRKSGGLLSIVLHQEDPLHNVRPAADFLLRSVAQHVGSSAIGVVLTGMGRDGAQGLLEMKKKGCFTMAQSEKTCVVFGMPQAAHQVGATDLLVDLEKMPGQILKKLEKNQSE